jgi:hypothetical protein
MNQDKN